METLDQSTVEKFKAWFGIPQDAIDAKMNEATPAVEPAPEAAPVEPAAEEPATPEVADLTEEPFVGPVVDADLEAKKQALRDAISVKDGEIGALRAELADLSPEDRASTFMPEAPADPQE